MNAYPNDSGINLDAVNSGLKAVRSLRMTIGDVFKTLADGIVSSEHTVNENQGANDKKYIIDLQASLGQVISRIRDLETAVTLLGTSPLNLGATSHLCQDPMLDRTPLYSDMIRAYRWFDRVHEHTSHAASILHQNSLKRSNSMFSGKRRQRMTPQSMGHNVLPQHVDNFMGGLQRQLTDMSIDVVRPCGSGAVLKICLGRTLRAIVSLRGLVIEWVLVKGFQEDLYTADEQLDIWTRSRYEVFQKVTDHANAAMLHFYSPNLHELAVKSFLTWLHSYQNLFSQSCKRCGLHLLNNFPPTWRCVRNMEPYHDACRP